MNVFDDREAMMELVACYALGVLPASEHRLVTAFLLEDAQARAEFDALRPAADAIGYAAEGPVDSARSNRMRERLMSVVAAEGTSRNVASLDARRARPANTGLVYGTGLAAAAAVVFALVSVIQNFSLRSDLANATSRVSTLQTQIASNESVETRETAMMADLIAGDAQRFTVPQGQIVKRGDRVYFALSRLPQLPKGHVYQAWTLAKGAKTVAPSVTFVPNAGGVAVIALPGHAATIAAVAMSVEPEGGSKAPTTKPAFLQPLS